MSSQDRGPAENGDVIEAHGHRFLQSYLLACAAWILLGGNHGAFRAIWSAFRGGRSAGNLLTAVPIAALCLVYPAVALVMGGAQVHAGSRRARGWVIGGCGCALLFSLPTVLLLPWTTWGVLGALSTIFLPVALVVAMLLTLRVTRGMP